VHGYTGFIVAMGIGRAMWNVSLMPIYFLLSAMVSGAALLILASADEPSIRAQSALASLLRLQLGLRTRSGLTMSGSTGRNVSSSYRLTSFRSSD